MKDFLLKHSEKILGVLSGFDRLIFRGSIRQLMYEKGMSTYLSIRGILLKDVMRFLGKNLTSQDNIHGGFKGEVMSSLKERPEGVRVKHGVSSNSVKLYDKAGSVLRAEGTINNPSEFKVYRFKESSGKSEWQPMRKSIKDITRRAEVSQNAVSRQLEALTFANVGEKFPTLLDAVAHPIRKDNLKMRGLDPFIKDRELVGAIIKGEYSINGFRNRDIRKQLFKPTNKEETKKCSAKVTRMFKLLRSHGIIKKVPRTHRYMVTKKGTQLISAIKTIQNTNLSNLLKLAA